MIKAEIIADSKNEFGQRITTFVLTFPRIVLAEFNTHRMLSRNSASSRAIPFEKMLKMVEENPFIPIKWMKDHKGMQGNEYFTNETYQDVLVTEYSENEWLDARDAAIEKAKELSKIGLTKQICNRLLEPFMYHKVICTGTEWENFFALRAHPAAEIHIADLAEKMLEAYNQSEPKQLRAGEWHIPFGDTFDQEKVEQLVCELRGNDFDIDPDVAKYEMEGGVEQIKIKIATARCARISYNNFEGKDDYEADIKLHDNLLTQGHMSPMEHCAKVMGHYEYDQYIAGNTEADIEDNDGHGNLTLKINLDETKSNGWCGNFRGFIQYRKTIQGENKQDNRVKK